MGGLRIQVNGIHLPGYQILINLSCTLFSVLRDGISAVSHNKVIISHICRHSRMGLAGIQLLELWILTCLCLKGEKIIEITPYPAMQQFHRSNLFIPCSNLLIILN